jgi:hypothetical protein
MMRRLACGLALSLLSIVSIMADRSDVRGVTSGAQKTVCICRPDNDHCSQYTTGEVGAIFVPTSYEQRWKPYYNRDNVKTLRVCLGDGCYDLGGIAFTQMQRLEGGVGTGVFGGPRHSLDALGTPQELANIFDHIIFDGDCIIHHGILGWINAIAREARIAGYGVSFVFQNNSFRILGMHDGKVVFIPFNVTEEVRGLLCDCDNVEFKGLGGQGGLVFSKKVAGVWR